MRDPARLILLEFQYLTEPEKIVILFSDDEILPVKDRIDSTGKRRASHSRITVLYKTLRLSSCYLSTVLASISNEWNSTNKENARGVEHDLDETLGIVL